LVLQFITPYSIQIGVAGAGTMGSGIALAMLLADLPVTLYDLSPAILEKAQAYIVKNLERKNRQSELSNLNLTSNLDDLHTAGIVIEAAPENLELKRELFARLDKLCPPPAILATNTSTLSVTAIAAATGTPERVAGMHFFNPAPVLPLVEVVRGPRTSADTVQTLVRLSEKLGKTAVVTRDTPGFIVNRVARPFYGEALRLLGEGAASVEKIDQVVRMGGGFRMGPFQLMDLIGIDINLAAMQSMYEQSFGEPRYRPHRIQVQMVQQNALGRKMAWFYAYGPDL
jgi:3-hydroxybutyryl-CoA dehydrogenase